MESGRNRRLLGTILLWVPFLIQGCAHRDLFEAASEGSEKAVHEFLRSDPGAVHATDSVGRTALHRAAEANRLESVRILIDRGADPAAQDRLGFTPLDYARLSGAQGVAEHLLARLTLFEAVRRGEPELIERVISRNPDSIDRAGLGGLAPIHLAISHPDSAVLEQLLREGAEPNLPFPTGESPLQRAIERADLKKAQLLLDAGADPDRLDSHGRSPLYIAIGKDDTAAIDLLLDRGANPTLEFYNGLTPLQIAAQKGQLATVERLLDLGAPLETRNRDGRDALFWARTHRHYTLAHLFEERLGADDD